MKKLIMSLSVFIALSGTCFTAEAKAVTVDGVAIGLGTVMSAVCALATYGVFMELSNLKPTVNGKVDGAKKLEKQSGLVAALCFTAVMNFVTYRLYKNLPVQN